MQAEENLKYSALKECTLVSRIRLLILGFFPPKTSRLYLVIMKSGTNDHVVLEGYFEILRAL